MTNTMKSESSSTTTTSTATTGGNRIPLTLRDFFFQDPFFQNSWDDFERIRQDMMKQSQDFWNKVRQDNMALMSEANAATTTAPPTAPPSMLSPPSMDQDFGQLMLPRRWMLPRFLSRDETEKIFPSDFFDFGRNSGDNVLRVKDDDSKFELSLDTHEFRPDELKVNVNGNVLSVEAKHEEKSDNKHVLRQFSRKYTLPEGCEAHKVSSNLSSDGILMISAPKRPAIKAEDGSRPVPIEMKK